MLVVGPYKLCKARQCHGSLSNSLIEFTVDGQVVCDGRSPGSGSVSSTRLEIN